MTGPIALVRPLAGPMAFAEPIALAGPADGMVGPTLTALQGPAAIIEKR